MFMRSGHVEQKPKSSAEATSASLFSSLSFHSAPKFLPNINIHLSIMNSTKHSAFVKTRFLILSDAHGMEIRSEDKPSQHADVAIHCGDLIEESKLEEYKASI